MSIGQTYGDGEFWADPRHPVIRAPGGHFYGRGALVVLGAALLAALVIGFLGGHFLWP